MSIDSYGYIPATINEGQQEIDLQLLIQNLDLLLRHTDTIISNDKLFFCPLSFSWVSWCFINGDGPLFLGYILLGYRENVLTGKCQHCEGTVLIVSFGGSPLSGSNSWSGVCSSCKCKQNGSFSNFRKPMNFVLRLRKSFPESISKWEWYNGFIFSWGTPALKPVRKKKLVWVKTCCNPLDLTTLITALKTGDIPQGHPPNVTMLEDKFKLKFSNKLGGDVTIPSNIL